VLIAQGATSAGLLTLIGTVSGVGITGIIGLATLSLNRRWHRQDAQESNRQEEVRRLRDQQKEVYAEYVLNIARIYQMLQDYSRRESYPQRIEIPKRMRDLQAEGESIHARCLLVASDKTIAALEAYRKDQVLLILSVYAGEGYTSLKPLYDELLRSMRDDSRG
jgi:hypothetical protein